MFGLSAQALSGWDFLIAGLIVLFVEYVVKWIFQKASEQVQSIAVKVAPIVIGAVVYLVLALVQGSTTWYAGLIHGVFVGLTAMGSYDLILKTVKESGMQGLTNTNEAIKEAIEGK